MDRSPETRPIPSLGRRLAQALAAFRVDLSWRFAAPGAFRRRFEQAVANMPQGICLYDSDDRLQLVNEQFCRIYNQQLTRLHTGMSLYDVLTDSCAIGNYPGRSVDEIYLARKTFIDQRKQGTFFQQLGDGRLIAIYHQPLKDGGWVCTYEDITERRQAEARVHFLAHHDALTELPNRTLFSEQLERAMEHASADNPMCLLCLDLDGFKDVNDRLGHGAGDILLKTVAQRLRERLTEDYTPARLGGDEFAVVLPRTSVTQALDLAHRIASGLRQTYFLAAFGPAQIAASIGIACAPVHATTRDELLLSADRALYASKKAARSTPVVFDPEWDRIPDDVAQPTASTDAQSPAAAPHDLDHKRGLAADLAAALDENQLSLHYQPIFDRATGHIVAFEALARWTDPVRGSVSPAEFIAAAEEFGHIGQLTDCVLASACREATRWAEHIKVGVNLSPLNLHDSLLVAKVEQILKSTGLAPSRLVLELTERTIAWSEPMAVRLHTLNALGIELWIDGFGAGYANFAYLQHLPCSVIKIDGSFLAPSLRRRELLAGMMALARSCGLRVAMKGVETQEHRDLVTDIGCDYLQGFLLARPGPADQIDMSLGLRLPFDDGVPLAPTINVRSARSTA